MADTLYIVIPAYNEQDTMEMVIDQWYPLVEMAGGESRMVVVNDGSRDRTEEILNKLADTRPRLVPLTKPNGGHGAAVLYGYRYALEHGAEYIFQTDSDGQTLPEEFAPFWQQRQQYDMLIGDRSSRQDGFSRVFVTRVLRLVIRLCFGVYVQDANTPYRLMKAESLAKYIDLIPKDFNLSNVIISVMFKKKGLAVKYIPITFRPRQGGVNSINMKKICKIGAAAVRDFRTINQNIR